ncbi:glycosyl hydrolase family 28-related protein [Paraburkholderia pallida]|uniref:Rhamnogalacturonase A/B/Epimerase-like pectate lyase domain-containing protein n=1 Tax=Paraburkholderia pallida TaxID=2547399 RepID=A0A4P7CYP8_9BURK|nr:glycosyl hydrolase family 28-related protein [Paraburkholderia pallida]QBQ99261.1 hypothetical protein E1956_18830 [Paraburkholderia pallida]
MNVQLAPMAVQRFCDNNGNPLAGGQLYTYQAGTTTPQATYTDSTGSTPNANPVALNARGEASVWLALGQVYKFVLQDSFGNTIWTQDQVGSLVGSGSGGSLAPSVGITVQTIAALRLIPKNTFPAVSVTGYYKEGDGGGGVYWYNASDISSADNGGTIIEAADGGRWYLSATGTISVKQFGATGNGTTDDTASIQAALTALGAGASLYVPPGTYLLSSTLTGLSNQQILGAGPNQTIFQRTGNYGDTLYIATANAARVSGIWFQQSPSYTAGETTLPNLATSGAQIHLVGAQQALIENCWAWRLVYGVHLDGCTLTTIRNCWIQGVWDDQNAGCQEGIANIWLDNASGNCEIIKILDNYLNGAKSAARNLTWTAADGTVTVSAVENIGSQYGVLVFACEDLLVDGNFIGANNAAGLMANLVAGGTNLDWRITNNFFDDVPTHGPSINFTSPSDVYVNGCAIAANVFNGELVGLQAIQEYSAGTSGASPALTNFSITGNTFQAHVGTPITLYGAVNGVITGNMITGYNSRGVSAGADATFCAAVNLVGSSSYVHVHGNNCGGAVDSSSPFGAYTHLAIANTGTNAGLNSVHDNMFVGGGTSDNQIGVREFEPTFITSTANYQATATDRMVIMAAVRSAAWSFGLPTNPPIGRTITLKDGVGQAGTYGVQVLGTVDGVTNPNYSTNYFTKTFIWNATASQWNVISN